jgi:hypothetical protein
MLVVGSMGVRGLLPLYNCQLMDKKRFEKTKRKMKGEEER